MSPLVFLCLSLLVVGLSAEHHGDHMKDPKDALRLGSRLDDITHRIQEIEKKVDFRLNDDVRIKARSLNARLTQLEEDHCDEHHFDCGGQDNECVSRLMVCDGHRDCRNGADEHHCSLPTNIGDKFIGYKVYDHCDEGNVKKVFLIVHEVKVRPAFPGFPMVRVVAHAVDDEKLEKREIALPMVGYYKFSNHNLVLLPPQKSQGTSPPVSTGLVLDFDGHNPDRAVGHLVSQVSLQECGQFMFYRAKHDRHDDDDDDNVEHDHVDDHKHPHH